MSDGLLCFVPLQSLPKDRYELRVDMHASNSHAAVRVGGQRLFAGDTPITIHWPDSSKDVISITASYKWNRKEGPYDVVRVFKLNGNVVSEDNVFPRITIVK